MVLSETQGANVTRYVHSPRGIHAQEDASGNWAWMMQDGLGSVRSVVDDSLGVLWTGSPAPFGVYFNEVGTQQSPYLFTGEYTDPITELIHLRARDYSPVLGVFPSLDPVEGITKLPMSLNRYAYVMNNPINAVDPSGMQTSIALEFERIVQQADAICSGHPFCVAAVYTVLLAAVGIKVSLDTYDPERFRQYEEYLEGVNEGRIPRVQDIDDNVVVTLSPQIEQAMEDALRSPGPTDSPDDENDPTPTPAPFPLPTPEATCTPTPTDTPERVLFGQRRISSGFDYRGYLAGKTVYSLAQELRTGVVSPQSIHLDVFDYPLQGSPVLVTINNRRLAALSLAGFRPTNITRIPFLSLSRGIRIRLTERPLIVPGRFGVPNKMIQPPSEYTAVTPSKDETSPNDVLDVIRIAP